MAQFGWVDLDFVGSTKDGVGVGDDKHSWGYDGYRVMLWFNGQHGYGARWHTGDVIGCAVDVDMRTMTFYHKGRSLGRCRPLENIEWIGGVCPGVTLNPCALRVNFGAASFTHRPPPGHHSVHEWLMSNSPPNTLYLANHAGNDEGGEGKGEAGDGGDGLPSLADAPSLSRSAPSMMVLPWTETPSLRLNVISGTGHAYVDPDGVVTTSRYYPSLQPPRVKLQGGKWYEEEREERRREKKKRRRALYSITFTLRAMNYFTPRPETKDLTP